MPTNPSVPKVCEKCGKEFLAFRQNVGRFCSRRCYWDTGGNSANRQGFKEPRLDATEVATEMNYVWAAGVYEGEGTCHGNQWHCKDGRTTFSPAVRVNQVDPWLPNRLRALFGGSVRLRHNDRIGNQPAIIPSTGGVVGMNLAPRPFEIYEWNLNGQRAREFLSKIYPDLSPRRQGQVRKAFGLADHEVPKSDSA